MKHKDFVDLSVYAMILSLMRSLFLLSLVWLTSTYLSLFLKLNMTSTAEDSNEKHLSPWSEACEKDGIETTPLSPFLDQELLYDNHLCINGSKIEETGFRYNYPELRIEFLREVLADYVKTRLFPPSLAESS